MLWGRFDKERQGLDICAHPKFESGSGIASTEEILRRVEEIYQQNRHLPHATVKAMAAEFILDHAAVQVNPADWFGVNFCGWLNRHRANSLAHLRPLSNTLVAHWRDEVLAAAPESYQTATKGAHKSGALVFGPDYDHSVPDWDSVIGLGFFGLLQRVEQAHQKKREQGNLSREQEIYYTSVERVYRALLRFCRRLKACAVAHEGEDEKMPLMIEALESLCSDKPRSFYQYLLTVYVYHLVQEFIDGIQARTLGNLDVDGFVFYQKDLAEGRLEREQAKELVKYFFERFTHESHLHGQPVYFGGMDRQGNSLVNELSFLMLEAYDEAADSGPMNMKLFIKVMPNTPDAFLKQALDMIRRGNSSLVFVNEELGRKIFRKLGCTEEEVHRLVATGCNSFATRGHETTPEHCYVNLVKGIELVFNQGVDPTTGIFIGCNTPPVEQMEDFSEFLQAYYAQTEHLLEKAFVICDYFDAHLYDMNPALFYSGTMQESVDSGRDAYYNGLKYNNTLIFLPGHATAADSLRMVEKHVFEEKNFSLAQLREALAADWRGFERMRSLLLNDREKFGNNLDVVDHFSVDLFRRFCSRICGRKNLRGGHYVVNGESIYFAQKMGQKCGATPDGRVRGDSLSKNMGASFGQDRRGITALVQSVTKVDTTDLAGGAPFDYMLHPTAVKGEEGLQAMLGLLRTFMKRGGYGFQGNVLDSKTLLDAQEHPEKYPTLQVRICGWNWYFTKMDKEYQDEFIARALHRERTV